MGLTFCKKAFWNIFQNGGAIQDGGFSTFYFQKIAKNQRVELFSICKLICIQKYLYFMTKLTKKFKMATKNQDGDFFYFFQQKIA